MLLLMAFGLNVVVTVLVRANLGPAASKLAALGLVGEAARAPFYLLQLYIAPAIVLFSQRKLERVGAEIRQSSYLRAPLTISTSAASSSWQLAQSLS